MSWCLEMPTQPKRVTVDSEANVNTDLNQKPFHFYSGTNVTPQNETAKPPLPLRDKRIWICRDVFMNYCCCTQRATTVPLFLSVNLLSLLLSIAHVLKVTFQNLIKTNKQQQRTWQRKSKPSKKVTQLHK